MKAVLLVHGLWGSKLDFYAIKKRLQKNKKIKIYEFMYKERWGRTDIELIAKKLSGFVDKNILESSFDIIGLSQGGIIAKCYIEMEKRKKIRKCFTFCTPFQGSLGAYLSPFKGFLQLRPKSELLKRLEKQKDNTEYYSIYTLFDLMVIPGQNAVNLNAKENLRVMSPLHQLAFFSKKAIKFVERRI